jgi:hypothetical protein
METVSECDKFYVLHIQREMCGFRNIFLSDCLSGINNHLNVKIRLKVPRLHLNVNLRLFFIVPTHELHYTLKY